MSTSDANWLYFVVWNADGSARLIVRRDRWGSSWGPVIQLLSGGRGWIDRPQLLTRFSDAGYLEAVTSRQARAAAEMQGTPWPGDDPASEQRLDVSIHGMGRLEPSLSRHLPPQSPEDPDPSFPSPRRTTSEVDVEIVGQQGQTGFLIAAGAVDGLPAARVYDASTNEL